MTSDTKILLIVGSLFFGLTGLAYARSRAVGPIVHTSAETAPDAGLVDRIFEAQDPTKAVVTIRGIHEIPNRLKLGDTHI